MDTEDGSVALGVPPEEGRFCADCKFLVGVRYKKEDASNWNCGHLNNSRWEEANLITGIKNRVFKFNLGELRYLNSVDSAGAGISVCGKEGRWYEKYEEPTYDRSAPHGMDKLPEYKPVTAKPEAFSKLKKKITLEDM